MKVKTEIFRNFLNKISINGKVEKAKIEFKDIGVLCITSDAPKYVIVSTTLGVNVFTSYESIGTLGFGDLGKVIKWFGAFTGNEEIEIKKGEGTIVFSSNKKKLKIVLTDPEFIDTMNKLPGLKEGYENIFTLTSEDNKSIQKNYGLFKDSNMIVNMDKEKKTVTFEVGKVNSITETLSIPEIIQDGKIEVGDLFMDVLSLIEKECSINLRDTYPIKVVENLENIKTVWIVAPIVGGKE